jgi:hypothetical protein
MLGRPNVLFCGVDPPHISLDSLGPGLYPPTTAIGRCRKLWNNKVYLAIFSFYFYSKNNAKERKGN